MGSSFSGPPFVATPKHVCLYFTSKFIQGMLDKWVVKNYFSEVLTPQEIFNGVINVYHTDELLSRYQPACPHVSLMETVAPIITPLQPVKQLRYAS